MKTSQSADTELWWKLVVKTERWYSRQDGVYSQRIDLNTHAGLGVLAKSNILSVKNCKHVAAAGYFNYQHIGLEASKNSFFKLGTVTGAGMHELLQSAVI